MRVDFAYDHVARDAQRVDRALRDPLRRAAAGRDDEEVFGPSAAVNQIDLPSCANAYSPTDKSGVSNNVRFAPEARS